MTGRRPRLLIVEDAEELLEVWVSLLRMADKYTLRAVSQGKTALELVDSGYRPDILITDFFLGDTTGLELADEMADRLGSLGVIIATGNHDNEALASRAEDGKINLLIKPVRFGDLTHSIDGLLQSDAFQWDAGQSGAAKPLACRD